jgi:hypothetical protein
MYCQCVYSYVHMYQNNCKSHMYALPLKNTRETEKNVYDNFLCHPCLTFVLLVCLYKWSYVSEYFANLICTPFP